MTPGRLHRSIIGRYSFNQWIRVPGTFPGPRTIDAVGEAGVIVGSRNEPGPALAGVDHEEASLVAREVNRGGQARRSAADDETIEPPLPSWPSP
jgi:hypothetical protein